MFLLFLPLQYVNMKEMVLSHRLILKVYLFCLEQCNYVPRRWQWVRHNTWTSRTSSSTDSWCSWI